MLFLLLVILFSIQNAQATVTQNHINKFHLRQNLDSESLIHTLNGNSSTEDKFIKLMRCLIREHIPSKKAFETLSAAIPNSPFNLQPFTYQNYLNFMSDESAAYRLLRDENQSPWILNRVTKFINKHRVFKNKNDLAEAAVIIKFLSNHNQQNTALFAEQLIKAVQKTGNDCFCNSKTNHETLFAMIDWLYQSNSQQDLTSQKCYECNSLDSVKRFYEIDDLKYRFFEAAQWFVHIQNGNIEHLKKDLDILAQKRNASSDKVFKIARQNFFFSEFLNSCDSWKNAFDKIASTPNSMFHNQHNDNRG